MGFNEAAARAAEFFVQMTPHRLPRIGFNEAAARAAEFYAHLTTDTKAKLVLQ